MEQAPRYILDKLNRVNLIFYLIKIKIILFKKSKKKLNNYYLTQAFKYIVLDHFTLYFS